MYTAFCSEIVTDSIILLHIFNICLANGEALDHTLWRTCFVRGRETVVRLQNEWMKIGIFYCVWKCLNLMCDCLETTDTSMITVVLGVAAAYIYIAFMLECILLTYLLTPWSRVLLEKLAGFQLVKKFTAFYGTWRFITTFTSARHLSLSWASSIHSTPPCHTSWRSILILSFHLCLGLPSGLVPPGFPTKTLYTSLHSPIHATCPAQLNLLDFITWTIVGEEYRSLNSSLYSFLHSPITSPLLGPYILLNTLSLCSSLVVSDQVSHPVYNLSHSIFCFSFQHFHFPWMFTGEILLCLT